VAVAAHLRGLTGREVLLEADGGQLEVAWRGDGVWLTGGTTHVFVASLSADFVAAHS
jgi:diaminopimelate epimerase